MEAITYKTALKRNEQVERGHADAERARWQQQAGVKKVAAKAPDGGW